MEKYCRAGQATDDKCRIRIAYCITKATNPHSECVPFFALARQQWLRECASVLGLYIHCLSCLHSTLFRRNGCYGKQEGTMIDSREIIRRAEILKQ